MTDTNLSKAEVTVIVQSMGIFSYNAEKIIEIRQQLSEVIIKIKIVQYTRFEIRKIYETIQ